MLEQGTTTNAKEDTVIFLDGSATADQSQYGEDLTASGSGGVEAASSRAAITSPREVYVRWTATNLEASVVLVRHGNTGGTDETFEIGTTASGRLGAWQNGVQVYSGPGVGPRDYSIAWSTRPNPLTTGASDAMISEVMVYEHLGGALGDLQQFTHAEATTSVSWALSVGGSWDGAALTGAPVNTPSKVRIGEANHSHIEAAEDWVAARASHTAAVDELGEPLGPVSQASGLGSDGMFAGAWPLAYAHAHSRELRRRMWGPMLNEAYSDAQALGSTPTPAQWMQAAPNSSAYRFDITKLRWLRAPEGATHAKVRVHVHSWVTSGAAVPVGVRCYVMNRPPGADDEPFDYAFAEQTITVDHGAAGVGEWLDFDLLDLRVYEGDTEGWEGTTFLCLAAAIDPDAASSNDVNARLELRAWWARAIYTFSPPMLEL